MFKRLIALIGCGALAAGVLAVSPAGAAITADPGNTVAKDSKWFGGTWVNMWGLNCSTAIIGSSYNEIMTQATGMYGGDSAGGVPRVNQTYYAAIRLSEPGNPCGTGFSVPELRLRLPRNTQLAIDQTHPVRCFVSGRFNSNYEESTNAGDWTVDLASGRVTGPWCQAEPRPLGDGSYSIGTPAMANGTMHMIFVPIRSSTTLSGEDLQWEVRDPSTYEGSVTSTSKVYVFSNSGGSAEFFVPANAASTFWNSSAQAGAENQLEVLMNLYTAGKSGTVCFAVLDSASKEYWNSCKHAPPGAWNGTVTAGMGLVQFAGIKQPGPNGGYVPFAFPVGDYGKDFLVQWSFTSGPNTWATSPKIAFRTLAGPDGDGDGVIDSQDQCPTTVGKPGNGGCPPDKPVDTDGDGVVGVADKCPEADGKGALDGCPAAPGPTPNPGPQKTQKLPKKLRKAKNVKSSTPRVCTITGKGSKARVVVVKAGTCSLKGKVGKKTVKATFKVS